MKINRKIIIGVLAGGSVVGGLAWATPIFNLALPVVATGNQNDDIEARGNFAASSGEFKAFMKTEGPSTSFFRMVLLGPVATLDGVLIPASWHWPWLPARRMQQKELQAGRFMDRRQSTALFQGHEYDQQTPPRG